MALTHLEVRELIARSQKGDEQARHEVIENNLRLVWSVVQRFQHRGYEADDLYQIGCVGLVKAVDKFDLSFDVRFSTYAVPMMIGEIQRFIRDDGTVKISRSLKELDYRIRKVRDPLTQTLGRMPTIHELAAAVNAEPEQVILAMEALKPVHSIYETMYEQDGDALTLFDQLADKDQRSTIDHVALRDAIERLEPREQRIVYLRYFRDQTQSEVASELGISQVQVSRLEKRILCRLRDT